MNAHLQQASETSGSSFSSFLRMVDEARFPMGESLRRLCVSFSHDTLVQYAAYSSSPFCCGDQYHSIPIILEGLALLFHFLQVSSSSCPPPFLLFFLGVSFSCRSGAFEKDSCFALGEIPIC